jgi:adenosylmethionine---8-amino-7-oxononanoate aminotransferase
VSTHDLIRRDAACLWHPYTPHGAEDPPLAVVGAAGARLRLADGRELLDGISSWWACVHGHGHPTLVEAMVRQAHALDHVLFAGATHEPAVALAERLLSVAPPGLARVFYSDDGSTAVEVALKMAYQTWVLRGEPQRRVFVALEGGYHGDTFGAMAVGDPVPFFLAYAPLLFEVRRVPARADALVSAVEELGDQAAAVIIEPLLQAAGGMRVHGPELLRAAREVCDRAGLLLIADEVMTGFGRTGTLFACTQAGISPDLLCLAKGLTNGMLPLAATLTTEALFQVFRGPDRARFFPHGHTMTANPVACAVALASLGLCLDEDVPARFERIGRRIHSLLTDLPGRSSVKDLRRLGGVVALDLLPSPGDRPGYLGTLSPRLRRAAIQRGVLLRPLGNVLYAMPPACATDPECDAVAQVMRELVQEATFSYPPDV